MTGRRYLQGVSRSLLTTGERIQLDGARRGQAQMAKAEAEQRRGGRREHAVDPTDPGSATEWYPCPPGCPIHTGRRS